MGGIVVEVQLGLAVNGAKLAAGAVLCVARVKPLVGVAGIVLLGLGLAPGVVVAVFLGAGGAHVARCPQGAAGQPQVHPLVLLDGCGVQDDVDDGIDVGDGNLAVTVHVGSDGRSILSQDDGHDDIDIGDGDLAIEVHITLQAGISVDLHNLLEVGVPAAVGLIGHGRALRHVQRAARVAAIAIECVISFYQHARRVGDVAIHVSQVATVEERPIPDASDRSGNGDARQTEALTECIRINAGD